MSDKKEKQAIVLAGIYDDLYSAKNLAEYITINEKTDSFAISMARKIIELLNKVELEVDKIR